MKTKKLAIAIIIGLWLFTTAPVSTAQVPAQTQATFQVPITHIRAYTALYPDFFDKVELESSNDKGITYLDEIEKRKYIMTAEEFKNRPRPNYTMYIYDKTPDNEKEWLALAVYYMGDYRYVAQYHEAEKAVIESLKIDPQSFEAYAPLFYLYDRNRVEGNASFVLEKLETLATSPRHYGLLGSIYAGSKTNPFANSTKSTYYYEKALELDPDYAPAYAGLAAYYHNTKDYPKATEYLEKFLELRPRDSWALALLEGYSNKYPPLGEMDPFVLVLGGIVALLTLNGVRALWKRRKLNRED